MTTHSVIPRYYWESNAKADPHFREDNAGAFQVDWLLQLKSSRGDYPSRHSQTLLGI
ncbi:hypothetical protein [Thalassotalea litorea]|uniref:hypothetical protein n=1 Tax=Thalassotalea litorea TaxID=2020715 RepID=UPI00373531FD